MPTKKQTKAQRAREIKAVRKLRAAGLISKRVNVRKKPAGAVKAALRKFADVVSGKAAVVKVPKNIARGLKGTVRTKGDLVIIERQKGERVRYDAKEQRIIGKRKVGKRTFTRRIERDLSKAKPARDGSRRYYVVPFSRGGGDIDYLKFDDVGELATFMGEYEKRGYKNWKNYVEIIDVDDADDLESMREEFPSLDAYSYKVRSRKVRNNTPTIIRKPRK